MKILEELYRVIDTVAIIARNINPLSKKLSSIIFYLRLVSKQIFASLFGIKIKKQKIYGRTFYFSDFNIFVMVFAEIFYLQPYDFKTKNSKPLIIDAGANVGLASFYFKQKYPDCSIICFEPSKRTFKFLKKNLAGFKDITFINSALSDRNGGSFLNSPKEDGSFVNASIQNRWDKNKYLREKTTLTTLSPILKKYKSIDFLKLDIEGVEEKVLTEINRHNLLSKTKEMFVEYHYFDNNSLAKVLTILENNGFNIITYGGIRSPYSSLKNSYWCLSIFAHR